MKNVAITILIFTTLMLTGRRACAQENLSAGGLVSAAYYMGDFNPGGPMYMPSLYVGGMLSYRFSDYYGLRVNLGGGELRGDPTRYSGRLLSNTPGQTPESFQRFFFDADARFEVGFLAFDPFGRDPKKNAISPYFSLGAGLSYSSGAPYMQLPLALGVKYRPLYRVTLGVEWAFRKTFNDNIDGWENIRTSDARTAGNNDWISYAGFYITYQLADQCLCHDLK